MTIQEILNESNILADEQIDDDDILTFLNRAISKINLEAGLLLPIADGSLNNEIGAIDTEYYVMEEKTYADANNPTPEEVKRARQLTSVNRMFIDTILIQYVHYAIKVQDGSQYEWNASFTEWDKNMRRFITTYFKFINDDYKGSNFVHADGTTNEYGLSVTPIETDSPVNSVNTWGIKPTSGNGAVTGVRVVDSGDVYGIK